MGKIYDALEKSDSSPERFLDNHESHVESCVIDAMDKFEKPDIAPEVRMPAIINNKLDKNLVTCLNPGSFEAEMFKILRSNILFPASGKVPKTIMVTSAVPGEGKSFIAANLSVSIAQGIEEHVLLMDCDMRKATIQKIFGLPEVKGLSDYLDKPQSIAKLLKKTEIEKLTLFPCGKIPPNPAELLSSRQMIDLLEEVKTRYNDRYIIIDAPPMQLTAETKALYQQVDGILFVVKAGSTSRKLVEELVSKLDREKILGIVLNWFNVKSASYYGYKQYQDYYSTKG